MQPNAGWDATSFVAYIALGVSFITLLYFGLHGMLFEHYVRRQVSLIPRLRYSRRHKCFYIQWVCCVCGCTLRQRIKYTMLDVEALEILLDDSKTHQTCKECQRL